MKAKLTFFLLATIFAAISLELKGQELTIKRASTPITIDGVMDEGAWEDAHVVDRFNQYFPYDSSEAKAPTEVRMAYDDDFVYCIAIMHNLGPREYVIPSLRRDYIGEAYDGFTLVLDTYKDKTNAFVFGVNPYGVQREGLISDGGNISQRGGGSGAGPALAAAPVAFWVVVSCTIQVATGFKRSQQVSDGGIVSVFDHLQLLWSYAIVLVKDRHYKHLGP